VSNVIITKYLTTHLDLKEEVLLVRYELINPLFPSKGPIVPIPYASYLVKAANNAKKQLRPYMGIHWRMETAKPELIPSCAKDLVKYIKNMKFSKKIKNIYFVTDYPLINTHKSRSSIFQNLNNNHHEAMKLLNSTFILNTWVSMKSLDFLYEKFPEYKKEIDQEFEKSGIQEIFDKLILINGDYFISGPRNCASTLSNFTKSVSQARRKLIKGGNKSFVMKQ